MACNLFWILLECELKESKGVEIGRVGKTGVGEVGLKRRRRRGWGPEVCLVS